MTDQRSELSETGRSRHREPHRSLLRYYIVISLLWGPFFPIVILQWYFRYHTLRYEFDGEGITMRWGRLFRREISLTYARIQDIHLTSNVIERWFGLARIQIQTASGSAGAEMVIEGLKDFEAVRDDLYSRMRGVRGGREARDHRPATVVGIGSAADTAGDELAAALLETAAELRRLRESLAGAPIPAGGGADDV